MNRLHLRSVLLGSVLVLTPATAFAHAYAKQPPARNSNVADLRARGGGKTGPCAGMARTTLPPTAYASGAQITVQVAESVGHAGCYQVWFSQLPNPTSQADFMKLGQLDDPNNAVPAAGAINEGNVPTFNMNVTLPQGVSCKDCTLQVVQIMDGVTCTANANQMPNANTYYSCADIRVGDFPDAGPTTPPMPVDPDASVMNPGSSSGGPNTEPTPGNGNGSSSGNEGTTPGSRRLGSGSSNDDGGCNVGSTNSDIGIGAGLAALVGLLAVVRRRRA